MDRNAIRIVPDGSGREENNDYNVNSNYDYNHDCNYDDSSSSSGLSSSSSSSSSGLSSSSSSSSSSGLSSLSSNDSDHKTMVQTNGVSHRSSNNGDNNLNNTSSDNALAGTKRVRSRVPLFRCVVWMALVSVIGFFLGRDFAKKDPQAKLWLDSVVLLKGPQPKASLAKPNQTEAASSEPSTVEESQQQQLQSQSQFQFQSQSPLLRQYLAEFQQRTVVLPRFETGVDADTDSESEGARAASRSKEFAELVVHPVLLVSGTDNRQVDPSETVAIALDLDSEEDSLSLAQHLVGEVSLHESVRRVTVLWVRTDSERKTLPDHWGCPEHDLNDGESEGASDGVNPLLANCRALDDATGCPIDLLEATGAATAADARDTNHENGSIALKCLYVDASWGTEREEYIGGELLPDEGFDVSFVLSGCDSETLSERYWEIELYRATDSMAVTCSGPRRPPGRSITSMGVSYQRGRIEAIEDLLTNTEGWNNKEGSGENENENEYHPNNNLFERIVDYDVQGLNIAVAFHKNMGGGLWKWHFNEANYQHEIYRRIGPTQRDLPPEKQKIHYFDAAAMIPIQFPSRQSGESYCQYLADLGYISTKTEDEHDDDDDDEEEDEFESDELYCEFGYNPQLTNIPIPGNIYVAKSTQGENSGRGVFTAVDILEKGTMIGMESNVHTVRYPSLTKWITFQMMDMKAYSSYDDNDDDEDNDDDDDDLEDSDHDGDSPLMKWNLHRSVSTYAEAYGYDDEPWGAVETNVNSNILTFVNHGCNGTANIGYNVPGMNEFTLDTQVDNFSVPPEFRQSDLYPYIPHRDRTYSSTITTSSVQHPPIYKGQELFDNYMEFGGETFFVTQILELQRDCSGGLGTVELQQMRNLKKKQQQQPQEEAGHHHHQQRTFRRPAHPSSSSRNKKITRASASASANSETANGEL